MTATGKAIRAALKKPNDWTLATFTAIHLPSGIELWIGSGPWFFDVHKCRGTLGLIERHVLWGPMRKVIDGIVAKRFGGQSEVAK